MFNPLALIRLHPRVTIAVGVLIAIAVVLFAVRRDGANDALEGRDREDAAAIAQAATVVAEATVAEGVEASADAATLAAQKEELTDEIQKADPSFSDGAALRLACGVLSDKAGGQLPTAHPCRALDAGA